MEYSIKCIKKLVDDSNVTLISTGDKVTFHVVENGISEDIYGKVLDIVDDAYDGYIFHVDASKEFKSNIIDISTAKIASIQLDGEEEKILTVTLLLSNHVRDRYITTIDSGTKDFINENDIIHMTCTNGTKYIGRVTTITETGFGLDISTVASSETKTFSIDCMNNWVVKRMS